MAVRDLTVTVEVRQRGFFGRVRRLPRAFRQHYRVFRRTNGRVVSAYGSWLMAGMLLKFK